MVSSSVIFSRGLSVPILLRLDLCKYWCLDSIDPLHLISDKNNYYCKRVRAVFPPSNAKDNFKGVIPGCPLFRRQVCIDVGSLNAVRCQESRSIWRFFQCNFAVGRFNCSSGQCFYILKLEYERVKLTITHGNNYCNDITESSSCAIL